VPPEVVISATYPGATAENIAATVAAPLEQQINGVERMIYMQSTSTGSGTMNLTVTFEIGTNLDGAQVLVQNRLSVAEPVLPEEVRRQGITVNKLIPAPKVATKSNPPMIATFLNRCIWLSIRSMPCSAQKLWNISVVGIRYRNRTHAAIRV